MGGAIPPVKCLKRRSGDGGVGGRSLAPAHCRSAIVVPDTGPRHHRLAKSDPPDLSTAGQTDGAAGAAVRSALKPGRDVATRDDLARFRVHVRGGRSRCDRHRERPLGSAPLAKLRPGATGQSGGDPVVDGVGCRASPESRARERLRVPRRERAERPRVHVGRLAAAGRAIAWL